jgi:hypothetical protein
LRVLGLLVRSLVEAALLDQERRILSANPREFVRPAGKPSKGTIKCRGGCGWGTVPTKAPTGVYLCQRCRVARRSER